MPLISTLSCTPVRANLLKVIFVLFLCVASATYSHAQGKDDLPLDMSNPLNAEDIEALLRRSGILDSMSDEEKQQQLDFVTRSITFFKIQSLANTFHSCQKEIDQFCSDETMDETMSDVNSCLLQQHDNLSVCCAANVRSVMNKPGISEPMDYEGFNLPKGSELHFYNDCQLSAIDVPVETRIGELLVGAGRFNLDHSGNVTSAWLSEEQDYKGLPIKNNSDNGTSLYHSGVPVEVTVASDVNYLGMMLKQDSKVGFHENGAVSFVTTSEPFTDKHGRTMIGKLFFHPNGNSKLGQLARPWTKSNLNLPAKTRVSFNDKGEFKSIYVNYDVRLPGFKNLSGDYETYTNGQIKTIYLHQQSGVALDGVAYPEFTTIEFDENGSVTSDNFRDKNVKSAHSKPSFEENWVTEEITEPTLFGVWEFPVGSIIKTDEQGVMRSATLASEIRYNEYVLNAGHIEIDSLRSSLYRATLAEPLEYNGLSIPMGSYVTMEKNGSLLSVTAEANASFNGNLIESGTNISFHNTGEVEEILLAPSLELFGNEFSKRVKLQYFDTGKLRSLVVDEPVIISGIPFDGDFVYFAENETVSSGILNANTRIKGTLYAAGTEIKLNKEGDVIHSWQRKPRWLNGKPPEPPKISSDDSPHSPLFTVGSERVRRIPLSDPLSDEECTQWFGEKDESGTYKNRNLNGFAISKPMVPAEFGCATTSVQAGILDQE